MSNRVSDMLFWRADQKATAWEKQCGQELGRLFGAAVSGGAAGNAIQVSLNLPTAEAAKKAWNENHDLIGTVTITPVSRVGEPLTLSIPLPFDGVFVAHRENSGRPLSLIWGSWLGEAPGFRLLRPTSQARRSDVEWRIGLPGGRFVGAPCRVFRELSKAQSARLVEQDHRMLCCAITYPEWLWPLLGDYGPRGRSFPKRPGTAWKEIHDVILDRVAAGDLPTSDQDDLDHRVLITFPVWLMYRLQVELFRAVARGLSDRELAAEFVRALRSGQSLSADDVKRVWIHLLGSAEVIATRVVPLCRTATTDNETVDRAEGLHSVDPSNPVDLSARRARIKRLSMKSGEMGELPAEYRQNHPSFRGRICPVISPESELVGLTLQLAAGAAVDVRGRIHPCPADEPADELGYGADLIPFFQHNDGTRNMMGAKNLRQALPVAGRTAPAVRTGCEDRIAHLTEDLTELGVCPACRDAAGVFALGKDLLVAYLPWYGMNFEDAIVVGQHVIDSGVLDVTFRKCFRRKFRVGWEPRSPDRNAPFDGVAHGLALEGGRLTAGSLIANMSCGDEVEPIQIRYNDRSPAVLRSIWFTRPQKWMSGILEYELEKQISLGIGDKLMGRHGNKGVVGAILPVIQMPKLPNEESIPKEFRGRPIDILLNPHGVISRMNIGQLLETHIGWLLHTGICTEADLVGDQATDGRPIGYPFRDAIDHDRIQLYLKKSGLDAMGRVQLVLPSGAKTLSPVVVGFQHIVRLRHIPELKAQARRGGAGAIYSRKTGQAVHGRIRGGGQRIGEMEIWALAGHQAASLLEEMLGGKADSDWAKKWILADAPPTGELSNGFAALFHDWLFALLIKAEADNDQLKLSFASPDQVVDRVGVGRQIEIETGLRRLTTACFCCNAKRKGGPCSYSLPVDGRIAVETPTGKDGHISSLKLADLVEHLGLHINGPVFRHGKGYRVKLQSRSSTEAVGELSVSFTLKGDQLKAAIRSEDKSVCSPRWPSQLNEIFAYGRFADNKVGGNIEASALLEQLLDPQGEHQLGDLRITCPDHKTIPLRASPPFGEVVKPEPRGLFDATIFGSPWSFTGSWADRHWGYIELPVEIRYPLDVFLSSLDARQRLSKTDRQKKVLQFLKSLGLAKKGLPVIRRVPVLPSHYRLPLLMMDEPIDDPLVRHGYGPLMAKCRQYREANSREARERLVPEIERCVGDLLALLAEFLRNKAGHIRASGLGRRVDRSARLVIVPNPALRWNQVGVPAATLFELLGDRIHVWLEKCGKSDDLLELVKEARARQDNQQGLDHWSWWRSSKDEELIRSAKRQLDEYLAAHPDTLVLLNRQPSLHRDSFQAFHPMALGPETGDCLQLCPLTCKGFAADFDGDEMVVHLPVSAKAQEEARRLLPSRNLFSLASGEVLAHFDQDFVMGSFWMKEAAPELHRRLLNSLPGDCCRALLKVARTGKKEGGKLLDHLAHKHPDAAPEAIWTWMNAAFECCSLAGVSFGFYDLRALRKQVVLRSEDSTERASVADLDARNSTIQKVVRQVLENTISKHPDWSSAGLHFAVMALSGARGLKQTRQIVGARGFLNPGATGFESDFERFSIASSLVEGMTQDEAFWAAMNARSSMCDKKLGTGHAGDLTRHLVFALWPYTVTCADCGSRAEQRSVLTCQAKMGCCSLCYGALPDGQLAKADYPVGLIAAQSIGERGTQLSMQSFHTGQRAFTISDVRKILSHGDEEKFFDGLEGATRFVAAFKAQDAYGSIRDCHFHVLWRVLAASPEHSLRSAVKNLGALSRIAFQDQARELATAALLETASPLTEPAARVLYGLFGARSALILKG